MTTKADPAQGDAQHYIGANWVDGTARVENFNPRTGRTLGTVPTATTGEIEQAVDEANRALASWRRVEVRERAIALHPLLEQLREGYGREGENTWLKKIIVADAGRAFAEADLEVLETGDFVEWFLQNAETALKSTPVPLDHELWPTKSSSLRREPRGVVAVLKPWNYPLEMVLWSTVPALLAGNTVVFKPSEHTPLVADWITRAMASCQLPPGVFNTVYGGSEVGSALVASKRVSSVSFTGSVKTGRQIAIKCAEQLKHCSLELGGNDAAIVRADVDIDLAAAGLSWGTACNAGQVCVRPKRVLVADTVAETFVASLVERLNELKPDHDFGPMISVDAKRRVLKQVQESVAAGAQIHPDTPILGDGAFLHPIVLTSVNDNCLAWSEEIFGPVAAIRVFTTDEEAVSLANDSTYGLGASLWSRDVEAAVGLADLLEVGMVWVNDVNIAYPQAPWGGRRSSGLRPELGTWAFEEYTSIKHVNLETGSEQSRSWWHPYIRLEEK